MEDEELEHLYTLKQVYTTRLRALEIKAAKFGANCPPEVTIEVEQINSPYAPLNRVVWYTPNYDRR